MTRKLRQILPLRKTIRFMDSPLTLNGQVGFYQGKVRDVYFLDKGRLAIVASDRISAFDHILPRAIPGRDRC